MCVCKLYALGKFVRLYATSAPRKAGQNLLPAKFFLAIAPQMGAERKNSASPRNRTRNLYFSDIQLVLLFAANKANSLLCLIFIFLGLEFEV
jgi:hypothetical protein